MIIAMFDSDFPILTHYFCVFGFDFSDKQRNNLCCKIKTGVSFVIFL